MITNSQLLCAPELRRYVLTNMYDDSKVLVTESMLREAFSNNPSEYDKIMSGRSSFWFLYEYFDGDAI